MTTSLDSVTADALKLSAEDRAALIERLADSVLPAAPLHPSWDAEIARRLAEMDSGMVVSLPADQVFAQARALIDAERPSGDRQLPAGSQARASGRHCLVPGRSWAAECG